MNQVRTTGGESPRMEAIIHIIIADNRAKMLPRDCFAASLPKTPSGIRMNLPDSRRKPPLMLCHDDRMEFAQTMQ